MIFNVFLETDAEFEDTMAMARSWKFPVLNISQFYPRPGTPAAKMKKCNTKDIKKRSREISKFYVGLKRFDQFLDTEDFVIFSEIQQRKGQEKQLVGHSKSYVKVILNSDD